MDFSRRTLLGGAVGTVASMAMGTPAWAKKRNSGILVYEAPPVGTPAVLNLVGLERRIGVAAFEVSRWHGDFTIPLGSVETLAALERTSYDPATQATHPMDETLLAGLAVVAQATGCTRFFLASGYRKHPSREHSQHKYGKAWDFRVPGISTSHVAALLKGKFGRIEHHVGEDFVHFDTRSA